jgi:hypothetical protein
MEKLTAVEWLEENLTLDHQNYYKEDIKKAKEMERGQIERAYAKGFLTEGDLIICCEQYMEETYGK